MSFQPPSPLDLVTALLKFLSSPLCLCGLGVAKTFILPQGYTHDQTNLWGSILRSVMAVERRGWTATEIANKENNVSLKALGAPRGARV